MQMLLLVEDRIVNLEASFTAVPASAGGETLPECPDARDVRAVDGAGAERDAATDAADAPPPPPPPPTGDSDAMPTRPTRRATNEGEVLQSFFCYSENDRVSQARLIRVSA